MQTPEAGSSEHFPIQMRHALRRALSYNLFPIQIRHPAPNQSEDQNAPPYRDQSMLSPYAQTRAGEIRSPIKSTAWGYKGRPGCVLPPEQLTLYDGMNKTAVHFTPANLI